MTACNNNYRKTSIKPRLCPSLKSASLLSLGDMHLIDGKCQRCLCFVFFVSIAAATMVALAIFRTLPGAICEGGFPTVISLRGRQHFWICSFLVSTVWRSQHKISEYLVDGISSALKKLSLYFTQRCVLWILGLPGKKWISGYHCQNCKNLDV